MLFYLISRNPSKDITLHVSANNPAMVVPLRYPPLALPDLNFNKATLQSLWFQSGGIHRRVLRRLS
jgi:hypothetical protein